MNLKVWTIDYKKGGEVTKLCNINDISPRLYNYAKKVKCNFCKEEATHLDETFLEEPIQIPTCDIHYNKFMNPDKYRDEK